MTPSITVFRNAVSKATNGTFEIADSFLSREHLMKLVGTVEVVLSNISGSDVQYVIDGYLCIRKSDVGYRVSLQSQAWRKGKEELFTETNEEFAMYIFSVISGYYQKRDTGGMLQEILRNRLERLMSQPVTVVTQYL